MGSVKEGMQTFLAGSVVLGLLHTPGTISPPVAQTRSSSLDTTFLVPGVPSNMLISDRIIQKEFETQLQVKGIVIADGLGGVGNPALLGGVLEEIVGKNLTIYRAVPENPSDPELQNYIKKIRDQVEAAKIRKEKVVLLGYSHGARATLLFLDSLLDVNKPTYNPALINYIGGILLAAPRDNNIINMNNYGKDHPHYTDYYRSPISSEVFKQIGTLLGERTTIFVQRGDRVVPSDHGERLQKLIPGSDIIEDFGTDNHFSNPTSGIDIGKRILYLLTHQDVVPANPQKLSSSLVFFP